MFQRKIDDFGKKLMATVRDEAILNCDGVASFRAESLQAISKMPEEDNDTT